MDRGPRGSARARGVAAFHGRGSRMSSGLSRPGQAIYQNKGRLAEPCLCDERIPRRAPVSLREGGAGSPRVRKQEKLEEVSSGIFLAQGPEDEAGTCPARLSRGLSHAAPARRAGRGADAAPRGRARRGRRGRSRRRGARAPRTRLRARRRGGVRAFYVVSRPLNTTASPLPCTPSPLPSTGAPRPRRPSCAARRGAPQARRLADRRDLATPRSLRRR